jgi:hypothetical protein
MALSVRGVARRYRNRTGDLTVRSTFGTLPWPFSTGDIPSLRTRLESLARREFSFSQSECIFRWTAAFQQTWSHVRVRIVLNPDAGIPAATMNMLRDTWRDGIEQTWSDRWGVGRTGEIICPLTFEVQWVTTNPHHTVRVRQGPAATNMTTWDTQDGGGTAAHEFGHMLGNVDEYTDSRCPNRSPVNTGTVMDDNSNNVPRRLMGRFATNVGSSVVRI